MKKENPGGFSFFIGAELRIRVKRGSVKTHTRKYLAGKLPITATLLRRACGE